MNSRDPEALEVGKQMFNDYQKKFTKPTRGHFRDDAFGESTRDFIYRNDPIIMARVKKSLISDGCMDSQVHAEQALKNIWNEFKDRMADKAGINLGAIAIVNEICAMECARHVAACKCETVHGAETDRQPDSDVLPEMRFCSIDPATALTVYRTEIKSVLGEACKILSREQQYALEHAVEGYSRTGISCGLATTHARAAKLLSSAAKDVRLFMSRKVSTSALRN